MNEPKKAKKTIAARWVRLVLFLALLAGFGLFYDLAFGGNLRFYARWIECGTKPLGSGVQLAGHVTHYVDSPYFSLFRSAPLFCSPREAELQGYSASWDHYRFPHLTPEEAAAVMRRFLQEFD